MKSLISTIAPIIIVVVIGLAILYPLEKYLEGYLSSFIASDLLVTGILLVLAFGPVLYFEEKIQRYLEKVMKRKLN